MFKALLLKVFKSPLSDTKVSFLLVKAKEFTPLFVKEFIALF